MDYVKQVLVAVATILGLLFAFFESYQSKKYGEVKTKETQENEALDNVLLANAIDDKYRKDPATKKAVDERFNKP